jgi:acyl carrier protein
MEEKILEILKNVLDDSSVNKNTTSLNNEKWDSMAHINLVTELEMEFDVSFLPEEFPELNSVDNIANILNTKGVK